MKSYLAADARLKLRDILDQVERGQPVEIRRYDRPTAVLVPVEWYYGALEYIESAVGQQEGSGRSRLLRGLLLEGQAVGKAPARRDPRVVRHLDGDPGNNDLGNLTLAEAAEPQQ